ncbi:hypothetical protein HYH03_017110 [Edaphochlamys debaryana]|uniref:Mitochondrial carrier protein n=1 Tax=Edaphochlamys debaryana TaxID=47281 RepID=A0A836BP93_9CHLO|nr:hypothetical protein HYH03_017110 [Edaphochlamys debaryana]|eukprot:KAG2484091.1 hypothetical protein HYH03_017110 [Edaphochlamys debaryana]
MMLPTELRPVNEASMVAASASEAPSPVAASPPRPLGQVLSEAGRKALGGGVPGALAMATQVLTLMWMRTTINYQYRYGTDMTTALRTLYKEGGVPRFYRGLLPALVQGPMSRFGDTAANAGTLALLDSYESSRTLPSGVKTLAASAAAGAFRILLMPVDTVKTIMQVEGKDALKALGAKVRAGGPSVLFHGALASSAATFVGHYPWFATYNYLNGVLPRAPSDDMAKKLGRSALMGFCSSFVSDCCSNSIRVIKTTKQTTKEPMTYPQVAKMIIAKDGVVGLFGRGLKTKIISNGVQGICFTIVWRMGQDWWDHHHVAASAHPPKAKAEAPGSGPGPATPQEAPRVAAASPLEPSPASPPNSSR